MAFVGLAPRLIRGAWVFQCGMVIDADGAKAAYRADNQGLDDNKNAMSGDRYVGVVTINGKPFEMPDGSWVSTSALQDRTKQIIDPARYVDASAVPGLAVCPEFIKMGVKLGDLAVVIYKENSTGLILYDISPHNHWGEASMAAAPAVGLNGSPRIGGVEDGCTYIVFPGTATDPAWPRAVVEFQQAAFDRFDAWGGLVGVRALGAV